MYRPTVRYADVFKEYVEFLYEATSLDRNQIIRAALFTAAHTNEFQQLLSHYQRRDVSLPSPDWGLDQHSLWMEQNPVETKRKVLAKNMGTKELLPPAAKEGKVEHLSERKHLPPSMNENKRSKEPPLREREPIIIRNQGEIRLTL